MVVIILVFIIWLITWLIECCAYIKNLKECMLCRKIYGCPYSFWECVNNPGQSRISVFICDGSIACRKHKLSEKDRKELLELINQLE